MTKQINEYTIDELSAKIEAIKAAAEVSRKDGKPCELIFDGCETNLRVSVD